MEAQGVIQTCLPVVGQFLSPIFLEPKPDGSSRVILNLKRLNSFICTEHFKLEDYRTASRLISPSCWLTTLDLKDAYYLVNIDPASRKYLRFYFQNILYEFTCLPFGLCSAPLVFTKLLKPVIHVLRKEGLLSVLYLDDFLLLAHSRDACIFNAATTCDLLSRLGFLFSSKKCQFPPVQRCKYLGFIFDSRSMTLELPLDRRASISRLLVNMQRRSECRIRKFAQFVGSLGACCPALQYAWVYTKRFEREKMLALQMHHDDYNARMRIPNHLSDFQWWKSHISVGKMPLTPPPYELEIFSDASLSGWGAVAAGQRMHGFWSTSEENLHINTLELKAAFLALQCFARDLAHTSILLRIDNTTAIAYINRMGGIQFPHLNDRARQIWKWCERRNLFIFASYISSADNWEADQESRRLEPETEYELNMLAFQKIVARFGCPEIDLFASEINTKCERYCSWKFDPGSETVDAFTISWQNWFFYAFPPFSLLLRTLQKIQLDKAEGIVVVPDWPSQPWYPLFQALLIAPPLHFSPSPFLLCSVNRQPHPLHRQLSLVAGKLSGKL